MSQKGKSCPRNKEYNFIGIVGKKIAPWHSGGFACVQLDRAGKDLNHSFSEPLWNTFWFFWKTSGWKSCEKLLWGQFLLISLYSRGICHFSVSIISQILMRYEAFSPCPFECNCGLQTPSGTGSLNTGCPTTCIALPSSPFYFSFTPSIV